jgi:thiamine-phosphate pyrophosphorylase
VTDRRALAAPGISVESARRAAVAPGGEILHDSIRRAASAGVPWIQIREKDLSSRALLELVRFAVSEMRSPGVRIIVNDRLDVAVASHAAGVHLGEHSLPLEVVSEWRRDSGRSDFLIGVSCHSLESVRAAERDGADYVFFGPVFATPSKTSFGAPQGVERLREACTAVRIPVLAIGGVDFENVAECIGAGAAGVTAIRLFQEAEDLAKFSARVKNLQLNSSG